MSILRVQTVSSIGSTTTGATFDGSFELSSENYMILPKGTTDERVGIATTLGGLRYNTDSNKVESWTGTIWVEVKSSSTELNGGARGVFGGSYTYGPSARPVSNVIDYITITTTGNATDFGDLTVARGTGGSCASSTRGIFGAGNIGISPYGSNILDYVTISSTGNATDFGDLTAGREHGVASCSSSTRGVWAGGASTTNVIDYITIASTGNAVDFGDLTAARYGLSGGASPTRAVFSGGDLGPAFTNIIDYVTIASTGNAFDFGDYTQKVSSGSGGLSSPIKAFFGGGLGPVASLQQIIESVTISTKGNGTKFSDLSIGYRNPGGASTPIRGVFAGGYGVGPAYATQNLMEYITLTSESTAVDFGDLSTARAPNGGLSNAHGGL